MKYVFVLLLFTIFLSGRAAAQTHDGFDVSLLFDYASAEQALDLFEGKLVNTSAIAGLRGSRIVTSTTGLIARRHGQGDILLPCLDSLRFHNRMDEDIFQLEQARDRAVEIRELLDEMQKRNFSSRIVSTVAQIFPGDARIHVRIPVYVVAFGHENVDAYVRRIVWHGENPEFTGEDHGELTIVINLAHAAGYYGDVNERLISILTIAAHEVFHAAFGAYKEESPRWKAYHDNFNRPFDALLDLVHNEGIAYLLSLEQQGHGTLPADWFKRTREVFAVFNRNAGELLSPGLSPRRATEILRSANLSGYWESYGAMTGMFMAREIDRVLGRGALIETIAEGPWDFLSKYVKLTEQDSNLPGLHPSIVEQIP
jgi:hypothetical protein